jgi:hypothetical protein
MKMKINGPIVFADTETTGLHDDSQIWEFAAIRREPDGEETHVQFFVNIFLHEADLFALKIGKYYDRHPQGRFLSGKNSYTPNVNREGFRSQDEAASSIARLTHNATIVGAVPSFDARQMEKLLKSEFLLPSWNHRLICIETLAVSYLTSRNIEFEIPWKSSSDLLSLAGVEPASDDERHTAMGDVRWAMRAFDHLTK